MSKQIAVWIDHQEARIFAVHVDQVDEEVVLAPHPIHHTHTRDSRSAKGHPEDDKRFFREVVSSLEGVEQVLIVGPSTAKLDLLRYIEKHDHALGPKVVGVETVDHPTDKQLAAYAKSYFKRIDRME
jgi:stalled ribosome rescue protein Dom34